MGSGGPRLKSARPGPAQIEIGRGFSLRAGLAFLLVAGLGAFLAAYGGRMLALRLTIGREIPLDNAGSQEGSSWRRDVSFYGRSCCTLNEPDVIGGWVSFFTRSGKVLIVGSHFSLSRRLSCQRI